jgi:hypothetical protein
MRNTAQKATNTGRRIQGFLTAQAPIVGTVATPDVQAELDVLVSRLEAFAAQQDVSDGTASAHTSLLDEYRRDAYVRFVRPIARISKRFLSQSPEITALVLSADDTRRPDIVTKLTNLANAAEVHQQTLIAKGMPSDFVVTLRAAIVQMTAAMDTRDRYLGTRAAAIAGLKTAQKELKSLIEHLDSLLMPILRGNPAVLADWISSKHIPKLPVNPLPTGNLILPDSNTNTETATDSPAVLPATPTPSTAA